MLCCWAYQLKSITFERLLGHFADEWPIEFKCSSIPDQLMADDLMTKCSDIDEMVRAMCTVVTFQITLQGGITRNELSTTNISNE